MQRTIKTEKESERSARSSTDKEKERSSTRVSLWRRHLFSLSRIFLPLPSLNPSLWNLSLLYLFSAMCVIWSLCAHVYAVRVCIGFFLLLFFVTDALLTHNYVVSLCLNLCLCLSPYRCVSVSPCVWFASASPCGVSSRH